MTPADRRSATVVAGLAAVLAAGTVVLYLVPDLQFVAVEAELDMAINTAATLIALGVAGLAWSRWRETGAVAHVLEAGAFAVLALTGLGFLVAQISGLDASVGMQLAEPNQTPLWARGLSRLVAGVLLLLAVLPAAARHPAPGRRLAVLAAVVLLLYVAIAAAVIALGDALPALIDEDGLGRLRRDPLVPSGLPGTTLLGWTVHLAGVVLFLAAAVVATWRATPAGHRPPYFAAGLVLAAFSQVHTAIYPGTFSSLVTTGDVLRLAFYATLLVGIYADVRADLRALRRANAELARLGEAEVARATLEERGRLAREIHDGVAQELWLARLKAGSLATDPGLTGDGRQALGELVTAIETGLADSAHAVIALRGRSDRSGIVAVLEEYAGEFEARFGLAVRVEADPDVPALEPRVEAESLRIVQEALNNARKHADATLVRITLRRDPSGVIITVMDNGRGFSVGEATGGFGLQSMAERARHVSGRLEVASVPFDGTTVTLVLPVAEPAPDG